MTRDELTALLMTHLPNGNDVVPILRRGYYLYLGPALGVLEGSRTPEHIHDPDARRGARHDACFSPAI